MGMNDQTCLPMLLATLSLRDVASAGRQTVHRVHQVLSRAHTDRRVKPETQTTSLKLYEVLLSARSGKFCFTVFYLT